MQDENWSPPRLRRPHSAIVKVELRRYSIPSQFNTFLPSVLLKRYLTLVRWQQPALLQSLLPLWQKHFYSAPHVSWEKWPWTQQTESAHCGTDLLIVINSILLYLSFFRLLFIDVFPPLWNLIENKAYLSPLVTSDSIRSWLGLDQWRRNLGK